MILGLLALGVWLAVSVAFPRTRHVEWTGADLIQVLRRKEHP